MPLEIIRNDITKVHADAIVNAANSTLLGGGGVDGAIHRAAGPQLLEECRTLGGCKTGQAKITGGYRLPAKYVIHTVGPVWRGGRHNEAQLLADCYRNSLALAEAYKLESIAFPLISTGAYGYPKDEAIKIAISVIGDFLLRHDMKVYLVVYDKASFVLSEKLFTSIAQYIDDQYIEQHADDLESRRAGWHDLEENTHEVCEFLCRDVSASAIKEKRSLRDAVGNLDETFSQMLLRLIREKDMTDAEVYRKANIDRILFSKIRNDVYYQPSKNTAIAFAIVLELDPEQTRELLQKAGYALSRSNKFDIIIQYFIENNNYNIFEINEALFAFNQSLLGV